MNFKFNLLLILVILFGCNHQSEIKDPVLKEFKKNKALHYSVTQINPDDLGEVVDILLEDTLLVVNEIFSDKIFKIFNIKSGHLIGRFISRGDGPNEMQFPGLITSYNSHLFSTFDVNRKRLIFLSIMDFMKNKETFHDVYDLAEHKNHEKDEIVYLKAYPVMIGIC